LPGSRELTTSVGEQFFDYLAQTPKALAVLVVSYFSGHLWVFMITAFFRSRTRGDNLLRSVTGRTAVGLVWFTSILGPFYFLKFGALTFEYANVLDLAVPTLVIGLFVQLLVFVACVRFGDR
jgi:flagellar biosynthesis protein FliQ